MKIQNKTYQKHFMVLVNIVTLSSAVCCATARPSMSGQSNHLVANKNEYQLAHLSDCSVEMISRDELLRILDISVLFSQEQKNSIKKHIMQNVDPNNHPDCFRLFMFFRKQEGHINGESVLTWLRDRLS